MASGKITVIALSMQLLLLAATVGAPEPVVRKISKLPKGFYSSRSEGSENLKVSYLGGARDGLEDIDVRFLHIKPGGMSPIHSHEKEKIMVFMKGEATYLVLEPEKDKERPQVYNVKKNSTVTVPAKAVHQVRNDGEKDVEAYMATGGTPFKMFIHSDWTHSSQEEVMEATDSSELEGEDEIKDEL